MNPEEFIRKGLHIAADVVAKQQAIEVIWLTAVIIITLGLLAWTLHGSRKPIIAELGEFERQTILGVVVGILLIIIIVCGHEISTWVFNPEFAIIDALFE